jgi:methylenetetrahydrofolate reductase (NADPH)
MTGSSRLQTLLAAGHFVVSAELTPPRHYNMRPFVAKANKIRTDVDVVQVNDNVLAQTRLSSTIASQFVWHSGIEPVVQMSLRHRHRIALQSDLLGLAALGIGNLLIMGGYPCTLGTDPEAKDVSDINTNQAIAAINKLVTNGQLFNGDRIVPAPNFYLGTIASHTCDRTELEKSMANLETKIECGAKFIQLQATFELESLRQWMTEIVRRGLHRQAHFLASIYLFDSCRELELLQKIPGLKIPEKLFQHLNRKNGKHAGLNFSLDLIAGIRAIEGIRGIHFRSLGYRNNFSQIIDLAGLRSLGCATARSTHYQNQAIDNKKQTTNNFLIET